MNLLAQMPSDSPEGLIPGFNGAWGSVGVVDSQALPLFGVGVETVISIAASAIYEAMTLHHNQSQ